jgi:hypothetical protein
VEVADLMSRHYDRNYDKEEVTAILQRIQHYIREGKYTIAKKRQENSALIHAYNLTSEKQRRILLQIAPEDFCHSLQNTKTGYEHETLFVFCPRVMLFDLDNEEKLVGIYIKFNIIERGTDGIVVVISFHKLNKPIDYIF